MSLRLSQAKAKQLGIQPTPKKKRPRSRKAKVESVGVKLPAGTLPFVTVGIPPSANNLYINVPGAGRVMSKEYKRWLKKYLSAFRLLKPPASLPCRMCYTIDGDVNLQRDGFNVEKALTDACVKAGVIPGDSLKYVTSGFWKWRDKAGEPVATVWLKEEP